MIVFAAITPHSPLLIPAIGKEHRDELKKTLIAYGQLEEAFYTAQPDTALVITPHSSLSTKELTLFVSKKYTVNLKKFGDLSVESEFQSDSKISGVLRRLRHGDLPLPINTLTDEFLDYGTAVPLLMLANRTPQIRVVPIGVGQISSSLNFEYGKRLQEIIHQSDKRIAIIGSADLSHTLTDSAPGGFSPEGKKFDSEVVQAFRKNRVKKLLDLDKRAEDAKACGLEVIALITGILDGLNCAPKVLSYEAPFGVGYMAVQFSF